MSFDLALQGPAGFDLARTVLSHGFHQVPPFFWDASSGRLDISVRPDSLVPRLPGQSRAGSVPILVSVTQAREARKVVLHVKVRGRARASSAPLKAFVQTLVTHVLDLDRDLREFHRVCGTYEPLSWARRAHAGRIMRCPDVFTDVVVSICGTNTTWTQAVRSVWRLCTIAPRPLESSPPCFPTAPEILAAGAAHLVDTARVGYRHRAILEMCSMVVERRLDLSTVLDPAADGPSLRELFRSLPGIGPITARYLATVHGRADELAVDSLVLRYIGDKYHRGRKPTARAVQRRYERFGDQRALAYWFEFLGDVDPVTWRGW